MTKFLINSLLAIFIFYASTFFVDYFYNSYLRNYLKKEIKQYCEGKDCLE